VQMKYVQLAMDKINAADLTRTCQVVYSQFQLVLPGRKKMQNSLPFHKFQELTNSDITKEVLNCTAYL